MNSNQNFFPNQLTLWEEFFLQDDFENYPANFMTRIRCIGRLSIDLVRESLQVCVAKHPLFNATIEKKGRTFSWVNSTDEPLPLREFESDIESPIPPNKKFKTTEERLWNIELHHFQDANGENRTDIFIQLHHTLCDGLGAIQFLSDVANSIHKLYNKDESCREFEIDFEALKNRGKFPQSWSEFFKALPLYYKTILASFKLIFLKVDPLVPVASLPELLETKKEKLGYRKIALTISESSRLRRNCRKQDTTVNSVVATELFQSVAQWKASQGHESTNGLRMVMPFNERNLKDRNLSACNRVSVSPFTQSLKNIADREGLLGRIEYVVRIVKKAKLGVNFHRGLWVCKTFFGSLKRLARTDRIGATFMFSNVGNLNGHLQLPFEKSSMRCGPILIDDIDLIPPVRVGTSFALTIHEFYGESRLGVHYDSAMMTDDQANHFFDYFEDRLKKLAE
ncbi:hypothetical protein OAF56_01925 [Pirellulaceae bacterium]|nr:hypothetical protein [Pirellulaceae bacterium]